MSYDERFTSLIDYICLPTECKDLVSYCEVLDDDCLNVSRHMPILLQLNICLYDKFIPYQNDNLYKINWKRITDDMILQYQEETGPHLFSLLLQTILNLKYTPNSH